MGTIGSLIGILGGTYYGIKIVDFVHKRILDSSRTADNIAEAKRMLGITDAGTFYRSDNTHPLYPKSNSLHPDNFDALTTLTQNQVTRAANEGRLQVLKSLLATHEQDLVLVGSPTGEGCSRILFGYTAPSGEGEGLELTNPLLDLPYHWILDTKSIDPGATAARYVQGRGLVRRPNWKIECSLGTGRLYVPEVDRTRLGLLRDDYLLITRVRNYFSAQALDMGSTILTFGGTHGVGTKAIDILFRDGAILSEMGRRLRGVEAYQALLHVGNIDHSELGSRASKIELIDLQILPDSASTWNAAHRAVKPAIEEWLNQGAGRRHKKSVT